MNFSNEIAPHPGSRIPVITGLILILAIGFLDVLLGLLKSPGQFSSFSRGATALALTVSVALILFSITWLLIVRTAAALLKMNRDSSAVSLAVFIGVLFLFGFLNDFELARTANSFLQFILVAAFCFSIAALSYVAFNTREYVQGFRKTAAIFLIAGPILLAELLLVLVIRRVVTGYSSSFILVCSSIALIVLFTATIWVFYRYFDLKRSIVFLSLLLLFSLLSPVTALLSSSKPDLSSSKTFKTANRPIRNVILVTIDTLRADALRLYSDHGVATPNIEALAKDATLYRKAYSEAPWTLPSVASLMTGLSPLVHLAVTPKSRIPSSLPTLAEYMYKAGFYTGAVGSNAVLEEPSFARGFIDYDFMPVGYYEKIPAQSFGLRILKWMENHQRSDDSTAEVTKLANEWIVKNKDKNFFLWVHYFDPHQPYGPPISLTPQGEPAARIGRNTSIDLLSAISEGHFVPSLNERRWIKELYLAEVRYVDDRIGSIVETLKQTGLYDNSLIVLTSDHGEEFWEHEKLGHGHSVYNELLRVPLMIKLPHATKTGEIESNVSIARIMPTILDLCRIQYDSNFLTANSLLFEGNPSGESEPTIISTGMYEFGNKIAVMMEDSKYIKDMITGQEQVFHLKEDREEQIPSRDPDSLQKANVALESAEKNSSRLREHYKITTGEKSFLNEEMQERLKALGYVQ